MNELVRRLQAAFLQLEIFFSSLISSTLNGSTLKGKIIRSVLAGAGAALIAFFVFSNPVGWAVGIGAAVFGVYLLAQLTIPTLIDAYKHDVRIDKMIEFKFSAWQRLNGMRGLGSYQRYNPGVSKVALWLDGMRGANIERVYVHPKTGASIYLSALPNKNDPKYDEIFASGEVGAVFSINEPWEIGHEIGNSKPYTRADYAERRIAYHTYQSMDHGLVDHDLLDAISDKMEAALLQGKSIVVHCRAGVGRSSQLVAANMIRHHQFEAGAAADHIKHGGLVPGTNTYTSGRFQATIHKKLGDDEEGNPGLYKYAERCRAAEHEKVD